MSAGRQFDPGVNYYAVLDVAIDASRDEITRTYRALMRITHPDNFVDPLERQKAEARAKEINAAYAVLSRPDIRREYDQVMRRQLMADLIMQRYSGNAPYGSSQFERAARQPSPQVMRIQRQASSRAIRQLLLTFVVATAALILVVVILALGVQLVQGLS